MKYYTRRIDNTDCHIFEFMPDNNTVLACTGETKLQKLEYINHDWHEKTKNRLPALMPRIFGATIR